MPIMDKLRKAISISRPIFWLGPPALYRLGLLLAGIDRGPIEIIEMLLLSFPLSFIIYGLNDLHDIEVDKKNPRKGGIWGAKLSPEDAPWVKQLIVVFSALIILAAISTLNPLHIFLSLFAIGIPYIYSVPPIRLKSRPILDSLVCVFYGIGPLLYAYSLSGGLLLHPYIFSLSLGFSGLHAIATIMDVAHDRKTGTRTFAAAFGTRAPAIFALGICLLNLWITWGYSFAFSSSIAFAALLSLWVAIAPTPENARTEFKLLFAYTFLWIGYFFLKYVLLGAWFADYSEMEFHTVLPELIKNAHPL